MFWRTCRAYDSHEGTKRSKVTKKANVINRGSFFVLFDLVVAFVAFVAVASAQTVDPALLLKPTSDSWPTTSLPPRSSETRRMRRSPEYRTRTTIA